MVIGLHSCLQMCLIYLSNSHEGTSNILTLKFIVYGLNVYTVIISSPVIHLGIYHHLMLINYTPPPQIFLLIFWECLPFS